MKRLWLISAVTCFAYSSSIGLTFADEDNLGGIQLLPGYKHEKLQGIDSIVGRIVKKDGLTISYEIGGIPQGNFRFGGSFTDRPKLTPKDQLQWYREQKVKGHPVHIAYLKNRTLLVSFPKTIPKKGINFHANVTSPEEMADVLLMLLTFPEAPLGKGLQNITGRSVTR